MKNVSRGIILLLAISCLKNDYRSSLASKIKEQVHGELYPKSKVNIENIEKCEKCDISVIVETYQKFNTLDYAAIEYFICTFDSDCKENVEFQEFSNEVLFEVIQIEPQNLISILERNKFDNKEIVLEEFQMPISDKYDIERIIEKVKKVKADPVIKEEIISSLTTALKKY